MSKRIFRKVSLERLSSPERLDEAMEITDARGWVALAAVGLLLVTAGVWSVYGTLPEKVAGSGILVRSGGVLEVVATSAGRVNDIPVSVGDTVTEGQVVAWIAQPDVLEQLQDARAELDALDAGHREKVRFARENALLQQRSLEQRRTNLVSSIDALTARFEALTERLQAQEELLEDGLVARPTLLSTRQQLDQTEDSIRANRNELAQLDVQALTIQNDLEETTRSGELKIEQARARLTQVERQLGASSQVASPYTGRILELMTEPGQIVQRGEPILSLDLAGRTIQDLVAVVYVPSLHGKKIKAGMEMHIAPSTVAREEHGMLVARVTFVSSFPATPKGMARVLKNQQLVQTLTGDAAPHEVHAELIVAPDTPSQYRWTSSEGPPTKIQSGTLAQAYITVATRRPIDRVLPLLRKWTGV